jgi:heme-degrading monooxygenase HmoA
LKELSVINFIEVPNGMDDEAIHIRNVYVDYFRKQSGFVSSTFYRSVVEDDWSKYVNIVVWDSLESFENVVNSGFNNEEGENNDGMKVLGKGFPEPIKVLPSHYEIIGK